MIGMIAASSINGVIGITDPITGIGKLPFHYPDDMRHFRQTTKDSVVIMGRKTFESMGNKPLPKRDNFVITSQKLDINGIQCFKSIPEALKHNNGKNTWFIGGASIYQEGMLYAEEIHLTLTPDYILNTNVVNFPFINPLIFEFCGNIQLSDPPSDKLTCAIYKRIKANNNIERSISNIKH